MIVFQVSFILALLIGYLFAFRRLSIKRLIILFIMSIANVLIYAYFNQPFLWDQVGLCIILNIITFVGLVLCNLYLNKPFGRKELNRKVTEFTKLANPNIELNIMAGDLTFFGEIKKMDSNPQVKQLKELSFNIINIVCKPPVTFEDKVRIGKLYHLLPNCKLIFKFYTESLPDLRLRLRYITEGNGNVSVINITKIAAETKYLTKLYSSASDDQEISKSTNVFDNLWNVYWNELHETPAIIIECKEKYEEYHRR